MNNEVEWLFEETNRELLLLSSCDEKEKEKLLESMGKNINELKRIWNNGKE